MVTAAAVWCALIFAPAAVGGTVPGLTRAIYLFFSPVCHQIDARSLHIFGVRAAVCARCAGIYLGFLVAAAASLGGAFAPLRRRLARPALWVPAAAPMLADVLCDMTGLHEATIATRLATGLIFGSGAGWIIMPSLVDGIAQFLHRRHTEKLA